MPDTSVLPLPSPDKGQSVKNVYKFSPTSRRGWGEEEQARLYTLAGIPPAHEVNGVLRKNGIRYLIHPILVLGGWATYEADLLGAAYGERAFGVKPILRERFGAFEAVETHLIHRERGAFDPWVIRSTRGLGIRHHRALIYILLDTAEQIYDWPLTQLEAFMAHPGGQILVATGRKGLRKITAAKTYDDGRAVIQDLFGLTVSQPTYTRRRAKQGGGDELNITWTTRRIIEGTSEAFERRITMMDGREVDTVSIGYNTYLVAAPQQITVSRDLIPWLWSSAQALRKQGIRPMDLQSRLDEEDSLMLRQGLLWETLAPTGWKIHELFGGLSHEPEFLADIFGSYEPIKTRNSWLSANRKKERRDKKRLDENSSHIVSPDNHLVMDMHQESPCESMREGAEVSLSVGRGAEVSLGTSKVSPEISKVSLKSEIPSHKVALNAHQVMDALSKSPIESMREGAEVSLSMGEEANLDQITLRSSNVSLKNSEVSLMLMSFIFNTSQFAFNNTSAPSHPQIAANQTNSNTSALSLNLDQITLKSSKVSLGPIFKSDDCNTSEAGFVPSSLHHLQASKQADPRETSQGDGNLPACLPAGEKEKVANLKTQIKGLSGSEIQDLMEKGILGDWGASDPHERKCLLDLICSVEEEGFVLSRQEAERMLTNGVMTARGAWAMTMCLNRRRRQGGTVKSICKSPHFNMRNWLSGNFVARSGERNAFFRDFMGIIGQLDALGWYDRPVSVLTGRERQALGSLDRMEVRGFPLSDEGRQEQARIALQRAQEARDTLRPSIRTPESLLAAEGGRALLEDLKAVLIAWLTAQATAMAASKAARMAGRSLTDDEERTKKEAIGEAIRMDHVVEAALAKTGRLHLPLGVAKSDDRTTWRPLLTLLEQIL